MIWAKEKNKRQGNTARLAYMSLFTLSLCLLSLTAFADNALPNNALQAQSYSVTRSEAEGRLAEALRNQGIGDDLQVSMTGRRSDELLRHQTPLVMEITELQPDTSRNTFSASLVFYSEAGLDSPAHRLGALQVTGRYDVMQQIPVAKYRLTSGTVIADTDIEWQSVPLSRIARDTVLDAEEVIGKTPVRVVAAGRPLKTTDLQVPPVVSRQNNVYMSYKSANISIQAVGVALQDGAVGDKVRVRNTSGGHTVEAVVTAPGQVQVLPAPHLVRIAEANTPYDAQPN